MWPELVCPLDQLPLAASGDSLVCDRSHRWPIEAGIPRMVQRSSDYADAFGLQWKVYRTTQLDSRTGTSLSYDRARRCLGADAWDRLNDRRRCDVLEVGCGAGRFTEVLLGTRNAYVTSVDYSSAVEANQENFPQGERHRVIQADVNHLPFAHQQYDIVLCLGVIQHTPDPEATLARLYEQVKPDGWLIVDHYTWTLSRVKSAWLFREVLKRLPPEQGLRSTEWLVEKFLPLHKLVRNSRVLQGVLSRVSPVLTYYHCIPQLDDKLQAEWALLDTHDALTDWYKHLRTKGQVEKALMQMKAADVQATYAGNGVEARCRRPNDRLEQAETDNDSKLSGLLS